jgi:hypothetical protein
MENKLNSLEKEVSRKADKEQMRTLEDKLQEKADIAAVKQIDARMQKIEKMSQEQRGCNDKHNTDLDKIAAGSGQGDKLNHMVDKNIIEQKSRERRKENIVVFNIEESTSDDVEDRKLYDLSEADRLLSNELSIGATVTNPVRLGLKREDSKYPRPLRITVDDEETKWKILKAAKNLAKSGEEIYKTVFIKRDMTPMEREQDADLRKQLAEKKRLVI